jgi:hypothetical protein
LADDQQPHRAVGHDRGGARAAVEERQLAEVVTGAQRGDLASIALHRGVAVEDHERLASTGALVDDDPTGFDFDLVGRPGDLLQVALRACREQPHIRQVIQIRASCHGEELRSRELSSPGKRSRPVPGRFT